MGDGQREDEGIISFLCQVNQVFQDTIRVNLWGLSKKQVLFARKYMNELEATYRQMGMGCESPLKLW